MAQDPDLIDNLYNAFNPSAPLPAGDAAYVNCDDVRGDGDILVALGNQIRRSQHKSCHLYSGHRGAGKSTELLRLKDHLKKQGCFVVYFSADEDINSEDTEYTDILLACTRHLLEDLRTADPKPLLNWLKDRWGELKDLAQSPVTLDGLTVEAALQQFTKLTANLRTEPTLRYQIRQKVNPYTPNLLDALNQFIAESKDTLPREMTKLVLIVDNLDRIAPIYQENGRSNHEEIFLDRSEQLKALDCHIVYTVPISLVYSKWATEVKENYGNPEVLSMLMVRTRKGEIYPPGLAKMKEIIAKRVSLHSSALKLDTEFFDSPATLERLCLMSGGHVRELMSLLQGAINKTGELPISLKALNRALSDSRLMYEQAVEADQWDLLENVFKMKTVQNNNQYRSLLFNRCVLEYRYLDEQGEVQRWYDVHPLLLKSEKLNK